MHGKHRKAMSDVPWLMENQFTLELLVKIANPFAKFDSKARKRCGSE